MALILNRVLIYLKSTFSTNKICQLLEHFVKYVLNEFSFYLAINIDLHGSALIGKVILYILIRLHKTKSDC